ncbi:MAG: zinc ribbon domain-containing protein [Galactobacter sp.]
MDRSIPFTDNFSDLSNDEGFQFEFRCERCGNGYRSTFQPDSRAKRQRFARGIGSVLSGTKAWDFANAAENLLNRSSNSKEKDRALDAAVRQISPEFKQCRGCGQWVCEDVCWNQEVGQCANCSPIGSEQLAQQQAMAREAQFRDKLQNVDLTSGYALSTTTPSRCPSCDAQVDGGKFCPECGTSLAATTVCVSCSAQNPAGARFCSECGTPTSV